jgi:hypothetical protein
LESVGRQADNIKMGTYTGVRMQTVFNWLGIGYSKPVVNTAVTLGIL